MATSKARNFRAVDRADEKKEFNGTARAIVKAMAASDYITPQKDVWMYEVQERLLYAHNKKIQVTYGLYLKFLKELKRVDIISLQEQTEDADGKTIWITVE
jgi:hypothetical protein